MLKEKFKFERRQGTMLVADFTAPTTEGYAMAWLRLTNIARELKSFWKIENERNTNNVYVICDPKNKEHIKELLNGIVTEYVSETDTMHYIGKIVEEYDVEVGVPVYEYESTCDPDDEQWEDDMDNAVSYWINVEER